MTSAVLFDDRPCAVGEGPQYDARTARVTRVDDGAQRLLWRDVRTGDSGALNPPAPISAAVPRCDGGWVFAELPAGPASPTGCVSTPRAECGWPAGTGGAVRRYTPDGMLDRIVEVPTAQVTSCTFAGDDLDLLVITTAAVREHAGAPVAGLTYRHRPGDVVGLPVDRFAG